MIEYPDVLQWLCQQPPEVIEQLTRDLQVAWKPPVMPATQHQLLIRSARPVNKIGAIKTVRSLTQLGLKEAKDFVESLEDRDQVFPLQIASAQVPAVVRELHSVGLSAIPSPIRSGSTPMYPTYGETPPF